MSYRFTTQSKSAIFLGHKGRIRVYVRYDGTGWKWTVVEEIVGLEQMPRGVLTGHDETRDGAVDAAYNVARANNPEMILQESHDGLLRQSTYLSWVAIPDDPFVNSTIRGVREVADGKSVRKLYPVFTVVEWENHGTEADNEEATED